MELIDKAKVIAEIERRISNHNKELQHASDEDFVSSWASDEENQKLALTALIPFLNILEVKEINTWHLQKNENIYDAVKDWSLHTFICLMDDGSVQKFTGILCECADGSINTHIDAIDDNYNVDNIIFWIKTPNLNAFKLIKIKAKVIRHLKEQERL